VMCTIGQSVGGVGAKSVLNPAEPGELREPRSGVIPRFLLGKIVGDLRSLLRILTTDLRVTLGTAPSSPGACWRTIRKGPKRSSKPAPLI
jgi:hypothetical protein